MGTIRLCTIQNCIGVNPWSANHNCSRQQILRHLSQFSKKIRYCLTSVFNVMVIFEKAADDSQEISCLICYFWKGGKILNCRLLQNIGGALRVKRDPSAWGPATFVLSRIVREFNEILIVLCCLWNLYPSR